MPAETHRRSSGGQALALALWLLIAFSAAVIGGIAAADAAGFYESLDRPPWAPPSWLFGPAWTVLYVLMGVSAWLVWRERRLPEARGTFGLFFGQLAANALWTWVFFAWRLPAAAFAEIVVLWVVIAATLTAFWRVRPLAGALLVPYLLWVTYAAALTFAIWRANPRV